MNKITTMLVKMMTSDEIGKVRCLLVMAGYPAGQVEDLLRMVADDKCPVKAVQDACDSYARPRQKEWNDIARKS